MGLPTNLITGRKAILPYVPAPKARVERGMNKTEAVYAAELEFRLLAGDIAWYRFESVKLRLAKRTWYTPDFVVGYPDGTIEVVEIKGGFVRDDAAVKFKVARETYPEYRWTALSRKRGEWVEILK